jgi:hypothetical protein
MEVTKNDAGEPVAPASIVFFSAVFLVVRSECSVRIEFNQCDCASSSLSVQPACEQRQKMVSNDHNERWITR